MRERYVRWRAAGWTGWVDAAAGGDPTAWLARAAATPGRTSRHARTVRVDGPSGPLWVKTYDAPGGWRAARAFRMGLALARAGFGVPAVVAAACRARTGLLVTRDAGGTDLLAAIGRPSPARAKRARLR